MKNITLAFLPGAKIGVLGINGAGKSTLLKIMAGHRPGHQRRGLGGRAASRSATCRRSRSSIPAKDVLGNVMEGVGAGQGAARPVQRGVDGLRRTPTPTWTR